MKTDKPVDARVKEVVVILQKLVGLGIPLESTEMQELKGRFDPYIREGECWQGEISFAAYGRKAYVNLPKQATKPIEVTLKVL
jgi:hypothetical protein